MSEETKRERAGYLDLLINTLMEHEKNLDRAIGKLEKIAENLSTPKPDFLDKVGEALIHLPKGYKIEIKQVKHTAIVEITWEE